MHNVGLTVIYKVIGRLTDSIIGVIIDDFIGNFIGECEESAYTVKAFMCRRANSVRILRL
jgi:hypothetical protein